MRSGILGVLLLASLSTVSAKELQAAGQQAGVASTGNRVELQIGKKDWVTCQVGDLLAPGDSIRTGPRSSASILLSDQTMMRLGENTQMTLVSMGEESGSLVETFLVKAGRAWARVTPGNRLQMQGPNAVAAVKGTVLEMDCLAGGRTRVQVWEGLVECRAAKKSFSLRRGQGVLADARGASQEVCALDPKDEFQNWNVAFDQRLEMAFAEPPPGLPAPTAGRGQDDKQTEHINMETKSGGEPSKGARRPPPVAIIPPKVTPPKKKRLTITPDFLRDFATKHAVK